MKCPPIQGRRSHYNLGGCSGVLEIQGPDDGGEGDQQSALLYRNRDKQIGADLSAGNF